jgi:ABC-type phosphate transport system substrate-binding protein
MSQILPSRWSRAALAAVLGAAGLLALAAPRSEAAFTVGQCQGSDIIGRGASFARDAHNSVWKGTFSTIFCSSVGTAPNMTYEPQGSGAGRRSMGERSGANADGSQSRNQAPRFGMTDEAPAPNRVNEMNRGTGPLDSNNGDEGQIHVVPAAVGSVAILVNFPNNCNHGLLNPENRTIQSTPLSSAEAQLVRVRFNKTKLEKAFASDTDADNWVELFPELATDSDCNVAITRVVRFDDSGTTFALKDFFDRVNPARDWIPGYQAGPGATQKWPNDGAPPPGVLPAAPSHCGATTSAPGPLADNVDNLTTGCANGNGPLVEKLKLTDGAIGYSDLSTARLAGFPIEPVGAPDNDTYWTQVPNGNPANGDGNATNDVFVEPTSDANGFRSDGDKGANCRDTVFTSVPTSTFGDWSPTTGVDSPDGYGICTLTYGLVFDDNAPVWGNTDEEQRKARTVKDYWTNVLSNAGQGLLGANDYSPLPTPILTIARTGINSVDWNKAGGSGGGNGGGDGGGGGTGGGGGGGTGGGTYQVPVPPSNRFSIVRVIINSRRGTVTVVVRVPSAGIITVRGRAVREVRQSRTVPRGGTYRITARPTRRTLRRLRRRGRLRTRLTVTYTPRGGTPRRTSRGVTLRLRRRARR